MHDGRIGSRRCQVACSAVRALHKRDMAGHLTCLDWKLIGMSRRAFAVLREKTRTISNKMCLERRKVGQSEVGS